MKGITKGLMISYLVVAASLLGYLALSYAGSYRVSFRGETLTMSPAEAKDGQSVTFAFSVQNDLARLSNVQIRVVEPCNSRGEGTVMRDLTGQVINTGVNTYRVTGTFHTPTGDKTGVCIQLLDRSVSTLPAPVITGSGYRKLDLVSYYKLGAFVPLI